tara:strand:- start:573 stop:713 length:141 start_codon:yes stop_codon:yes gene_type:complete
LVGCVEESTAWFKAALAIYLWQLALLELLCESVWAINWGWVLGNTD